MTPEDTKPQSTTPEDMTPEEKERFAGLAARVFTDPQFAKSIKENPAQALESVGIHLTAEQQANMEQEIAKITPANVAVEVVISVGVSVGTESRARAVAKTPS